MSKFFLSHISNRMDLSMRIKAPLFLSILLGAGWVPALAAAESKSATPGGLSAAQIVDKHVAARGGLQAWRAVQTLSVAGKLEAGTGDSPARSAKLRSEEHTSELQSHSDLVCRLLPENKKVDPARDRHDGQRVEPRSKDIVKSF